MENHANDLSQIALVLAAAFAGGSVLKRFGQPVIIGYILVGMLLGPSFLGLVNQGHEVSFLAELGILLLLFIIGMELDVHRFMEMRRIAVNTTLLQIGAGMAVMAGLGMMFDWSVGRIIVLGFAVSLSSTAVALKLLEDMGELNRPTGHAALAILIAQDLAVIPMLMIVGMLGAAGDISAGIEILDVVLMLAALLFLIGMIAVLGERDIGPLKFSRIKIPTLPDGGQTVIVALTACFTGAALSGAIGLSASYGAFLAGLVIGSTHKKEKYEEGIRPIFDLLMMVFFLSVGILIDFEFIIQNWVSVLTFLAAVLLLKTFFNIMVLRQLGLSRRHALIIGASLGQIGEFSFILAGLGLSAQAIGQDGYKFVVAVIALSLVMTPLWTYVLRRMHLLRHGRLSRLARLRAYRKEITTESNA